MFFITSKLTWMLANPATLLLALLILATAGLATRWRAVAQRALILGLAGFAVLGVGPIGSLMLRPLENRFIAPPDNAPAPTGLIVLGGGVDERVSAQRRTLQLNESGTRMTAAAALMRRHPSAQLVFSGGSGALRPGAATEADVARGLLLSLGVAGERMRFEDRSRDTYENALFSHALVAPAAGERWFLVTSASHMPRAVGAFRGAGFPVTAYPVDYATGPTFTLDDFVGVTGGLKRVERAWREYLGLAAYRLTGRISTLWPGPEPTR